MIPRNGYTCDETHPDFDAYVSLLYRMDLAIRSGSHVKYDAEELQLLNNFGFGDFLAQQHHRRVN